MSPPDFADQAQAQLDILAGNFSGAAQMLFEGNFQQGWREKPEPDFMPARVRLYANSEGFQIVAVLADRAIGNTATGFNQRTWETGDVFEVFLQIEDDRYFEFHITPENQRLFAVWTPELLMAFRAGQVALDAALIKEKNFLHSNTRINSADNHWTVCVGIPFLSIGFDPATHHPAMKTAFCRYDTTPGHPKPVLSATPPFTEPNFHDRSAWHSIDCPSR